MKKFISTLLMLAILSGSCGVFAASVSDFTDTSGHWAESSINYCIENSYMIGTNGSTFEPDTAVTNAMAHVVILRVAKMMNIGEDIFFNVPDANDLITREDVADIVLTVAQSADKIKYSDALSLPLNFSDSVDISEKQRTSVAYCASTGVMTGKENNIFDPKGYLTRAELAVIAQRFAYFLYNNA